MPLISPSSSLTNQFVFDEVKYNFTWAMYDGEEDDEEQLEIKKVHEITTYIENETGRIEQYGNMINNEGNVPPEWKAAFFTKWIVGSVKSTNKKSIALQTMEVRTVAGFVRKTKDVDEAITEQSANASQNLAFVQDK